MTSYSDKFLDESIEFWSRKYGKPISRQDSVDISRNLIGFIELLQAWQEEENAKSHENDINSQ